MSSHSRSTQEEYVLLLGNIGVGKSAICNALGASCESATQGAAVTTEHSLHPVQLGGKTVIIIDAPGLYERNKDKVRQNAKEIRDALSRKGFYRLIFVLNLSGGRLPEGELATMKSIYEAIDRDEPHAPIGVIVNRLTKKEMKMLEDRREEDFLLDGLQMACDAKPGKEACKISLFKIPFNGVGEDWGGNPPHADLAEWLLQLVTTRIEEVREIVIDDKRIEEMQEKFKALENDFKATQELLNDSRKKEEDRLALRDSKYGTVKTTVTVPEDLPTESNDRQLQEVKAKFANEQSVRVLVDREAFNRYTEWKLNLQNVALGTAYLCVGLKTFFAVPLTDWLISDDNVHINTKTAKNYLCGEVVRVESIDQMEPIFDEGKDIPEWSKLINNDVESEHTFFEDKFTEQTFSIGSTNEVGFSRLCSKLRKLDLKLQTILTGSSEITNQLTSKQSNTTTAQWSTMSHDEHHEGQTFKVPAGKCYRITKFRREKVTTTPFSMKTVYTGSVLSCGPGITARAIKIPANELWPDNEISWTVAEKKTEEHYECSSA